ncbi:MAG: acyl-CoA thioesterase [Gemmatimonadota bacterium]|nr:MAG: acyl-CoA thioesterase [Gemmatimonadota bacterium]
MAKTYKASLRVRFSELDLYGHVHHAEYLRYLEWARMEYLKQAGVSFVELMGKDIYIVVVNAVLNFNSPARYDEELIISGVIEEIGTTSLTMKQRIEERKTKRNILEAQFTFVFLNKERKKIPVPKRILRLSPQK